jgi:Starch-binding associating with outer membrane
MNMKKINYPIILAILLFATSCKDFADMQVDPNKATQTHPSLILTNLEAQTFNIIDLGSVLATRQMAFTDGSATEQYYNWQRASFNRYNNLRQAKKMDEEAARLGLVNYQALALFFKSYHIIEISKVFGDVPYSQALNAASGVYAPEYDTQEKIYTQVLNDLDQANTMLDATMGTIAGDIIYNGNVTKWKKLVNSFTLRVLISMSQKGGAVGTDVVNRFKGIVTNPTKYPIFESNSDNASLVFVNIVGNRYPLFNNNGLKTAYYMDESFVNLLKNYQDWRLFAFADRTPDAEAANIPATNFNAYGGIDGSAPLSVNTARVLAGEISGCNPRYYDNPTNEASNLMSYAEVQFTLAEAAVRGWITTPAATHYNNGILASFSFFGVAGGSAYVNNPGVAFSSGTGLQQILTQKYINFFLNGGWEAFYNHLRTGFPVFKVDGGGVLNNQQVPKRWMYPQDELQLNQANVEAAIARQYTTDNINGVMWLLKN